MKTSDNFKGSERSIDLKGLIEIFQVAMYQILDGLCDESPYISIACLFFLQNQKDKV